MKTSSLGIYVLLMCLGYLLVPPLASSRCHQEDNPIQELKDGKVVWVEIGSDGGTWLGGKASLSTQSGKAS